MKLSIITANVNSFSKDKQIEIDLLLKDISPTALFLQETCLKATNIQSKRKFNNKYDLIFNNKGRGTGILIQNSIRYTYKFFYNLVLSATIAIIPIYKNQSNKNLALVSIYVHCNSGSLLPAAMDELFESINQFDYIILGGDLNSRHPLWGDPVSNNNGIHLSRWYLDNRFLDFDLVAPLGPTRPSSGSHIDFFVISSNLRARNNIQCLTLDLISDHFSVLLNLTLEQFLVFPELPRTYISYKNVNWTNFINSLNFNLNALNIPTSRNLLESEIDNFIVGLTNAISNCIEIHCKKTTPRQDWLRVSDSTIKLFKTRKVWKTRLKRIYHHFGDRCNQLYMSLSTQIRCLSKIIKDKVRLELNEQFRNKLSSLKPSTNVFKIIDQITNRKSKNSSVLQQLNHNNTTLVSPQEKVRAFAEYYSNLYALKTPNVNDFTSLEVATFNSAFDSWHQNFCLTNFSAYNKSDSVSNQFFASTDLIDSVIKSLNNKKSAGHDNIPNLVLRKVRQTIVKFITPLINNCINIGYFPASWKSAILIPIKKSNCPNYVENYRPISLLPNIGKVLEKVIFSKINSLFEGSELSQVQQFGFKRGHSTEHALLYFQNNILKNLRSKHCTVACKLDLAKAFDSVWHDGLTYKLSQLSFPPVFIKIIKSFLSNRSLQVHFENEVSNSVLVQSGVPQGSILGPFLFNLYLFDFPVQHQFSSSVLYADDTILFSSHERPHEALHEIKAHLNVVNQYYKKWGISLNPSKCELISFRNASGRGHHLAVRESRQLKLTFEGQVIPLRKSIKYLGVHLHERMKSNPQARKAINNSKAAAAKLKLLLNSKLVEKNTKLLIYKSLIRPLLGYGFLSWFTITPNVASELHRFERQILRKCLSKNRRPSGKWHYNKTLYEESKIVPLLFYLTSLAKKRESSLREHINPLIRDLFEENIVFNINERYYISPISIFSEGSAPSILIQEDDNSFASPFYKKQHFNTYRG